MKNDVYERLARHLDDLPAGFPRTDEGVELRILRRLFSEEEADLACHLTLVPEEAEIVASRANRSVEAVAARLHDMAKKGLVFRLVGEGKPHFVASQYVLGIWEYHVNDLDEGLIRDMETYSPRLMQELTGTQTPQFRTIPVWKSVSAQGWVYAYEEAREIIRQQSKIAVADCICRKEHRLLGRGCEKPLVNCFMFSTAAHFYLANGLGREITQEEALDILDEGEKAGLVLQPTNSQKVNGMCQCCGCCCLILQGLKRHANPARHVRSNFYAEVGEDRCVGCEICLSRCQMDAVEMVGGAARVDRDRCIGCGLCATTCESGAIRLVCKPDEQRYVPPATMGEMLMRLAEERGKR
jgi:ferredoxin